MVEGFVDSVDVLDTHRVRFNFAEEAPVRERIGFAGGTPVFSKAWFEETGARIDDSTLEPFLGTGAYVVQASTLAGRSFMVETRILGADHPFNVGQNNFDTIRYEFFADNSAALEAFKAGEYTFRNEQFERLGDRL